MDPGVLDDIINRLLEVKGSRPGKQVQLSEAEIRQLCLVSKDIFMQQPNLLELEAPIKICGKISGLIWYFMMWVWVWLRFWKWVFVVAYIGWLIWKLKMDCVSELQRVELWFLITWSSAALEVSSIILSVCELGSNQFGLLDREDWILVVIFVFWSF